MNFTILLIPSIIPKKKSSNKNILINPTILTNRLPPLHFPKPITLLDLILNRRLLLHHQYRQQLFAYDEPPIS